MTQRERPMSPHLMIYRPQLTAILSIIHRGTGVGLAVGHRIEGCREVAGALGARRLHGEGAWPIERPRTALDARARAKAGPTAPPPGR